MCYRKLVFPCVASFMLSACTSLNLAKFGELERGLPFESLEACDLPDIEAARVSYQSAEKENSLLNDPMFSDMNDSIAYERTLELFGGISNRLGKPKTVGIASEASPIPAKVDISADEVKEFGKVFADTILDANNYLIDVSSKTSASTENSEPTLRYVFETYYKEYISGKFVDRFGTKISKPEIKTSIGNDVISAALLVFLEAVADTKLKTPIFFKKSNAEKKIYFPSGSDSIPTAAAVKIDDKPIVALLEVSQDSSICGVTEKEAKAIAYLANIAGDQSATLSKLAIETFGDIEIAFVVGGNFSVGDNETLATLTTTFFESVSRRGSERLAYEFFWKLTYTDPNQTKSRLGKVNTNNRLDDITDFVLEF